MKKSGRQSQGKNSSEEAMALIGSIIKDCREKKGLSQAELARMSNVSLSRMRRIEAGTGAIPISICLQVATALNTSLSKIIREAETNLKS